jgi:glucose-6-phosphate dehydrogenase assembly protein OpcA
MATTYKILGQVNPAATTATTAYTVPAGTQAIVNSIAVCNQASGAGSFRIAVRPAGATLAAQHYIAYDTPIGANDTINPGITLSLGATDVITVYMSTNTMSVLVSGVEIV